MAGHLGGAGPGKGTTVGKGGLGGGNKKSKSQTQNKMGTKYAGKLAETMAKKNAPKKETALNKSLRRRIEAGINVVSPQDAAAVFGNYVGTDEAKDRFGSKNKAAKAYAGFIQQQQQRLEDRFPDGARQLLKGKVTPAGANFALRMFNEAAGFNPTRGMGILDSLRSNYEQSGAKFNRNQAIRGIIGSLIGGPLGGILLGNMPVPGEERPEGINEFGMPIFDGRQIDEYRTFGSAPVFDDPVAFDTTALTPMMRPNMPRTFTPRTARAMRMPTRLNLPRITAGTSGVKFGQGSVPRANRFGTAGSPFQNQRMLNQRLSTFGQVGKGTTGTTGSTGIMTQQARPTFFGTLKNLTPVALMASLTGNALIDRFTPMERKIEEFVGSPGSYEETGIVPMFKDGGLVTLFKSK
jgi:hypothetical protein